MNINIMDVAWAIILIIFAGVIAASCSTPTKITYRYGCPAVEINDFEWTPLDKQIYQMVKQQCAKEYEANPCLTQFIKIEENTYHVVCGPKRQVPVNDNVE